MRLRELVEKYLTVGGGYGRAVAIASFGLPHDEAERVFSALDDDYQISRFFHFTKSAGEAYGVSGYPQTHLSIDAEIQTAL
ncbi:MAG TPA: hypothetical protein VMJ93_06565 [Verrucomicrobiae bacterium]|nr:hypothetical protein [Verrucomicrobiae bacterium]